MRAACRRLLALRDDCQVSEACNGGEGLDECRQSWPDIIILDLQLPDVRGLEALQALLAELPDARILVFSMYEDATIVAQALAAGAMGYGAKSEDPEALLAAIESIGGGSSYLGPAIAQKLALGNLQRGRDAPGRLSPRELEIFTLLGEGLSFEQIAGRLGITYKTVANRSTLIKEKLNLRTTVALVKAAVERRERVGVSSVAALK